MKIGGKPREKGCAPGRKHSVEREAAAQKDQADAADSIDLIAHFKDHGNNSITERLNVIIQSIKAAARGSCGFQKCRIRILFFSGNLVLHPL